MNENFVSIKTLTPDQKEFVSQVKKLRQIRNETYTNIRVFKNGMIGAVKGKNQNGHIKFEYLGHWDDPVYIAKWREKAVKAFMRYEEKESAA